MLLATAIKTNTSPHPATVDSSGFMGVVESMEVSRAVELDKHIYEASKHNKTARDVSALGRRTGIIRNNMHKRRNDCEPALILTTKQRTLNNPQTMATSCGGT